MALEGDTKSIITSLLASTPLRCTITQLCKDFREMVGYNLPFRPLGFSNAEEYLRSIPDVVCVRGSGPSAEVQAIVRERSAHIIQMVARQRTNAIPAHKRRYLKSCGRPDPSRNRNTVLNASSSAGVVPPVIPVPRVVQVPPPPRSVCEDEYKSAVPKCVQNNLRKLIMRHPEGIWCRKLRDMYCKWFKEDLNYEKYGFRSLIELCTDLTDIFHYIQPTSDDFMLYDKNKAVPQLNQNEMSAVKVDAKDFKIDWTLGPTLIPDDIVQFLDQIPQLSLNDIDVNDQLDVKIGEIYDIHKFYVYPKYSDLDDFLEQLKTYFHRHRNRYSIPALFLVEGLYCVANYNNGCHRCVIVDELPKNPDFVKVLFIDYGSVGEVPIADVSYLPQQFGTMPCQAMEAKLFHIKTNGDSELTVEKFKQLINRREVVAEVMEVDKKERILEVYLADVTDEELVFFINDALVEKGYAEYL